MAKSELVTAITVLLKETTHEERYQILRGFAKYGDGRSDMLSSLIRGTTIKDIGVLLHRSSLGSTDMQRLMKACTEFVTSPLYAEEARAGIHGDANPGITARWVGIAAWNRRLKNAKRK